MREYGVHCARLFVRLHLRSNGARDNANVTRRSHYRKSLLGENDRAVFRAKLVIIYMDWIALLRRLLMGNITLKLMHYIAHFDLLQKISICFFMKFAQFEE